ncbi:uncharacterized protein TNCV_4376701 [Trichonephila clavipes]|nr:uncharacterized protein TNCV_4376701 [Trichonephila clavipes]
MVSEGTEFALGDIGRLFEEARRNTKTKHEKWEKYYNRRRRDVQIKCVAKIKKEKPKGRVTPTTSGYNLRPRRGKREESRLTIERKTQQGGPVRSRKGRERNDSPYIEERTRLSNKNARRGGDQQQQDQEKRGTCTKKSLSLEVLVGNANCKS